MSKLIRRAKAVTKWTSFFVAGFSFVPRYIRHWGIKLAVKRSAKALILPGLTTMRIELLEFLEATQAKGIVTRQPDYIVVAPDYIPNSAGICCLYQLCADLQKQGFVAAMAGSQRGNPKYSVPLMPMKDAKIAAKKGTWVIYPEVVSGNPLGAKNVIRWTLNRPGLLGGDEVYPESEHVFVYSDVFAPYLKNEIRGKLYMPTIDRSIFYPPAEEGPRSLVCYYVGKSRFKEGYFDTNETLEITRFTPPKSELGKLFRSAKLLYSFDNSTALIYEALLCGCPVVIIPDGTQTWQDYEKLELGTEGISWGPKVAGGEPFRPVELEKRLANWEREYRRQLDFLISYTQSIAPSPFVRKSTIVVPARSPEMTPHLS